MLWFANVMTWLPWLFSQIWNHEYHWIWKAFQCERVWAQHPKSHQVTNGEVSYAGSGQGEKKRISTWQCSVLGWVSGSRFDITLEVTAPMCSWRTSGAPSAALPINSSARSLVLWKIKAGRLLWIVLLPLPADIWNERQDICHMKGHLTSQESKWLGIC